MSLIVSSITQVTKKKTIERATSSSSAAAFHQRTSDIKRREREDYTELMKQNCPSAVTGFTSIFIALAEWLSNTDY